MELLDPDRPNSKKMFHALLDYEARRVTAQRKYASSVCVAAGIPDAVVESHILKCFGQDVVEPRQVKSILSEHLMCDEPHFSKVALQELNHFLCSYDDIHRYDFIYGHDDDESDDDGSDGMNDILEELWSAIPQEIQDVVQEQGSTPAESVIQILDRDFAAASRQARVREREQSRSSSNLVVSDQNEQSSSKDSFGSKFWHEMRQFKKPLFKIMRPRKASIQWQKEWPKGEW